VVKLSSQPYLTKGVCILAMLFCVWVTRDVAAQPLNQMPSTVTLNMYVLTYPGGARDPENRLCNANSMTRRSFGCTFYPNDLSYEYPFDTNTITIDIEDYMQNGIQQGYLRNVVPQELDPGHVGSSVRAQAIAARTFAYWKIGSVGTLNNSTQFQAYIPYRYDALSAAQKSIVDQAVAGQVYMSLPNDTAPIHAHFGQDNDMWTTAGGTTYLKAVYDPISQYEGTASGTGNGGMGSKAAGRWGAGRTNEYPNHGAFWSVRWDTAQQILAHYYTGINFIGLNPDPPDDYRLYTYTPPVTSD
jgi:hypothetical protein